MRIQNTLPALLIGLTLAHLAGVSPADAAKADAAKIAALVEQLGSDSFADREEATTSLRKIGMPALGALRKASASKDTEIRKRAKDLLVKLEKEAASTEVLTPTKVHLVYKDTQLKDALEDLKKKTGARIVLFDPAGKLKDRKVTLDTGKTTFWDAFDQFCGAAGVVEGAPEAPAAPGVAPGFPGIPLAPAAPIPGVRIGIGIAPAPAAPPAPPPPPAKPRLKKAPGACDGPTACDTEARTEEEKKKAEEARKSAAEKAEAARKAAAVAKEAAKARAKAVPVGGAIRVQIGGAIMMPGQVGGFATPEQISLIPGKKAKVPTDSSSSIRVRVGDKGKVPAGLPDPKAIDLVLEVSPEPRLRWQSLVGVTIHKATDDNGVLLKQIVAKANPNAAGGFGGGGRGGIVFGGVGGAAMPVMIGPGGVWTPFGQNGVHQYIPVRLEKGAKASKSLAELTGTVAAYVQLPAEAMMTVDGLAKAKGKVVRGKTGTGELEVSSYSKAADGTVTIQFSLAQPENVIPETQLGPPNAAPAVPLIPAPPAVGGGGRGPRPAIARPIVFAMPVVSNFAPYGLSLRDDKNNLLPASIQVDWRGGAGFGMPGTKMNFIATYRPAAGSAEPAKLSFTARRSVQVDIPFKLKKVALK